MTEPTRDELLQQLADAQAGEEAAIMALIFLDLDEILTGLGASEDQVAADLRQAFEVLSGPVAQLAALDEKIASAGGKCSALRQKVDRLADDDDDEGAPNKRAAARMHLAEWEARVTRLRSKRDFAASSFGPLFEERDRHRANLRVLQAAKLTITAGMLDPFGPLGQQTRAYETYRMPQVVVPVLLGRDLESPEWDKAVAEFDELAMRSGLRTDHLPSEAEQIARALAEPMADASQYVEPVPSGQEVMAIDTYKVLSDSIPPSRIDDYRNPASAVPRNLAVPGYKRVQSLRDLGLG